MSVPPLEPERNPYAPPEADLGEAAAAAPDDLAEAEAVRRAHITHETLIKSLSALHLIGAVFGFLWLIAFAAVVVPHIDRTEDSGPAPLFVLIFTGINLALGLGLRGLRPWARWVDVALNGISLLLCVLSVIPAVLWGGGGPDVAGVALVFLIMPGFVLYLLISPKAAVVFSPGYKDIIARTSHVKMKMSWLATGCLIVLVTLVVLFVAGFVSFRSFQ